MALRPRFEITPSAFRISRKGVNVQNPPTFTPEHLAFNSDWGSVERRHAIAYAKDTDLIGGKTILFTPLDEPPLAVLLRRNVSGSTLFDTQTHISGYFEPLFNQVVNFVEDTHLIRYTTTNRVELTQKADHFHFIVNGAHTDGENFDKRNFDFLVLLFKRGA